jgi:hypothetical protein
MKNLKKDFGKKDRCQKFKNYSVFQKKRRLFWNFFRTQTIVPGYLHGSTLEELANENVGEASRVGEKNSLSKPFFRGSLTQNWRGVYNTSVMKKSTIIIW